MVSPGLGSVPSVGISKTSYTERGREVCRRAVRGANHDSVSISPPSDKESRFSLELVSALSREVRTATLTGDLRALHEEVASGRYTPDPARIAANMLFLGENL